MWIVTPHSTDADSSWPRLPLMTALGAATEAGGLWVQEIDACDPAALFSVLADAPGIAFLDSAAIGDPRGGCSYLCIDPLDELIVEDPSSPDLFGRLRALKARLPAQRRGPLPFSGGIVDAELRCRAGAAGRVQPAPARHGAGFGRAQL